MMRQGLLPAWIVGVTIAFALPSAPSLWWGVFALLLLLFLSWRWRWCWLLFALVLGMTYSVWRVQTALDKQWQVEAERQNILLPIQVSSLSERDDKRVVFMAKARLNHQQSINIQLADYQQREWKIGSEWQIQARLRTPIGESNIRGLDREAWALAKNIQAIGTVGKYRKPLPSAPDLTQKPIQLIGQLREHISLNWQKQLGNGIDDGVALMRALSVGEQNALSAEYWQAFRPLGLTHLISISGLHVSMVAILVVWITHGVLRFLPIHTRRPRVWILFAGMSAAVFYAALADFAIPTLRSALMVSIAAVIWAMGVRVAVWRVWFWALSLVLLFDPMAVLSVGTWLSFGLVAALLWSVTGRLADEQKTMALLRSQWAALWGTVLAVGFLFSAIPIWSPFANAVAIPWFSWVLVPFALLGSLLPFDGLQYFGAWLAQHSLDLTVYLAEHAWEWNVAAAPYPLLCLAFIAILCLLQPKGTGLKPFAILVLLMLILYQPEKPNPYTLKAFVLDVGQGSSMLLQTANHQLLFDTGTLAATHTQTLPTLRALGVRKLDALVLSHHDSDHDGGATVIQKQFDPAVLWAGQTEYYPQAQSCHQPHTWIWDGVHFEFLPIEIQQQDDNEQSCVLRVVAGKHALLVTGDLGIKGEQALVRRYGEHLYSQVLILGHHGSNSSSSGTFLHNVSPQYAIASSGYANAYKHPTQAVQNRVRAHRIQLLRTDLHGAWQIELNQHAMPSAQQMVQAKYWQRKPFR